ncbi:hypothetical protein BSM4216_0699 [Bacillus smithii]|nr:hypothetical protein BSM4216_0699 [Bacillus smithii]
MKQESLPKTLFLFAENNFSADKPPLFAYHLFSCHSVQSAV